jgi:carbonic anhydrase
MLDKIFGEGINLPRDYHGEPIKVEGLVISQVLKGLKDSYRYNGSLTAPANLGCANPPGNPVDQLKSREFPEVVSWVLLKDTIEMSEAQIAKFKALFPKGNARPPQPLRQVVKKTFRGN